MWNFAAMKDYQVIVLVLMIVFFLYFFVLAFVAGHGLEFRRRLRNRTKALLTLMAEKRRLLLLLDGELHHLGVAYSDADEASVAMLKSLDLPTMKYPDVKDALALLGQVETRLGFLSRDLFELEKDPQYQEWLTSLEEIDHSIRRGTSSYNMDVVALNYWVSIPLTGWINYLFGIKKRDPIV